MIIETKSGESEREAYNRLMKQVLKEIDTDDKHPLDGNVTDWHEFRKELNYKVTPLASGRTKPTKAYRPVPNMEGRKITRSSYIRTYPKRLVYPQQKLKYLEELYLNDDISTQVFVELADMLELEYEIPVKERRDISLREAFKLKGLIP